MYTVHVFNNTNGQNKTVSVIPGQTVSNALAQAGISAEGSMVRVNQQAAELNTPLGEGDRISVTKQGLKGAQMRTFRDLLNPSQTCQVASNALVAAAQERRTEEAQKQLVGVYKGLLEQADALETSTGLSIAELGRQLAEAEAHYTKVGYVLEQLRENGNPFPYYALTGRKAEAQDVCRALGVLVPANDSECWNTSPAKAAPSGPSAG